MEDIVAVAVELESGEECLFLTWGRIQDNVDPTQVEQIVLAAVRGFAIDGEPVGSRVCSTLQEVSHAPWFYECFFAMCQKPIPSGRKYAAWRSDVDRRMREGKEIWYLGASPTRTT